MISGVSRTYYELQVGAVYRSRFGRPVPEADSARFTLLTRNTKPIPFDAAYAAGAPRRSWRRKSRAERPFCQHVRHTDIRTDCALAPAQDRLPPQTLRRMTPKRIASSARQLVACRLVRPRRDDRTGLDRGGALSLAPVPVPPA